VEIRLTIDRADESAWTFSVKFENNSGAPVRMPVDAIKRRGDRVGLRVFLDGVLESPVGFAIAVPARENTYAELPPGQRMEVEFKGRLQMRGPDTRLCFVNAEYKVDLRRTYRFVFSWDGMESNSVEWRADSVQ
jgi:hypothetical protein